MAPERGWSAALRAPLRHLAARRLRLQDGRRRVQLPGEQRHQQLSAGDPGPRRSQGLEVGRRLIEAALLKTRLLDPLFDQLRAPAAVASSRRTRAHRERDATDQLDPRPQLAAELPACHQRLVLPDGSVDELGLDEAASRACSGDPRDTRSAMRPPAAAAWSRSTRAGKYQREKPPCSMTTTRTPQWSQTEDAPAFARARADRRTGSTAPSGEPASRGAGGLRAAVVPQRATSSAARQGRPAERADGHVGILGHAAPEPRTAGSRPRSWCSLRVVRRPANLSPCRPRSLESLCPASSVAPRVVAADLDGTLLPLVLDGTTGPHPSHDSGRPRTHSDRHHHHPGDRAHVPLG